ncbi:hypothetical protein LSAT2_000702 [Lamellibrachia satsuma]|nr:hypothetical protein LSAT2_000702 [Lamellibrachia satsuma]
MSGKERVYVFVRFGKQYILPMRNSLTTNLSVLKNYHGRILGIGECVETVDGYFPDGNALVVLEFTTLHDAHMWYNGCPEVRQHDWLHGVDCVVLPLRATAPTQNVWIHVSDIQIRDKNVFYHEYMPGHTKQLSEKGGIIVAASDSVQKLRGSWDIQFGAVYQWLSKTDFYTWYNSAENAKWRELQQEISSANVIIFKLAPLCKESAVRTCCNDDTTEKMCCQ